MNQEEQQYYDSLFTLFGTDGWKHVVAQLEANKAAVSSVRDIPDAKTLHFRQGQLDVIEVLLNLPSITEQSYKAAKEVSE